MAFKAEQKNITYAQTFAEHPQCDTLLAIIDIAKQGNALLRDWFAKVQAGEDVGIKKKGTEFEHFGFDDVFTQADIDAQRHVINRLKQIADIPVEAEEEDEHRCDMAALTAGSKRWLIDPIDGTFCFKQGIPDFSITIALQEKHADGSWKTKVGCVSDPMSDEVFIADEQDAYLIRSERVKRVLLTRSSSDQLDETDEILRQNPKIDIVVFSRQNKLFDGMRASLLRRLESVRAGTLTFSTALFLARLADGWYDGVILASNGLEFAWDTDAAIHIAEKAGAKIERYELGGEPVCLVAKNSALLHALKQIVKESYEELNQGQGRAGVA